MLSPGVTSSFIPHYSSFSIHHLSLSTVLLSIPRRDPRSRDLPLSRRARPRFAFRASCHPERERGIWSGGRRAAARARPGASLTLGVTSLFRLLVERGNPRVRRS